VNIKIYLDSKDRRVNGYVDKSIENMNAHQREFLLLDKRDTVDNQRYYGAVTVRSYRHPRNACSVKFDIRQVRR